MCQTPKVDSLKLIVINEVSDTLIDVLKNETCINTS